MKSLIKFCLYFVMVLSFSVHANEDDLVSLKLGDLLKELETDFSNFETNYQKTQQILSNHEESKFDFVDDFLTVCKLLNSLYIQGEVTYNHLNMANDYYIKFGTDEQYLELNSALGFGHLFSNANIHSFIAIQNERFSSLGFCGKAAPTFSGDFDWNMMSAKENNVIELNNSLKSQMELISQIRSRIKGIEMFNTNVISAPLSCDGDNGLQLDWGPKTQFEDQTSI